MYAIDLFSGAGGFTQGLVEAGIQVIGAVDSDPIAAATFGRNFDCPVRENDMQSVTAEWVYESFRIEPGQVDLIVGSPPRQGFARRSPQRLDDPRNVLILRFAELVVAVQPRMFIIETSTALQLQPYELLLRHFYESVHQAGFALQHAVINAADYGVPQIRRRLYIYGSLRGRVAPFEIPKPSIPPREYRAAWDAIRDLPSPPEKEVREFADPLHRRNDLHLRTLEVLRGIPPGGIFDRRSGEIREDPYNQNGYKDGYRQGWGRLAPDQPAPTITAGFHIPTRGKFAHPFENRSITLREGARLQTFPDHFQFIGTQTQISTMIGDATPPMVAAVFGMAIRQHLGEHPDRDHRPLQGRSIQPGLLRKCDDMDPYSEYASEAPEKQRTWQLPFTEIFQLFPRPGEDVYHILGANGLSINQFRSRLHRKYGIHYIDDVLLLCELIGLLYVDEDHHIHRTHFGRTVFHWLDKLTEKNSRILGQHAAYALAACQLPNPTRIGQYYDPSIEVFPCAFIWHVMVALEGKIREDELAHVLTSVKHLADLHEAIDVLAAARREHASKSWSTTSVGADEHLRSCHTWMSIASFGWVLIADACEDAAGYYRVRPTMMGILETALSAHHTYRRYDSREAYIAAIMRAAMFPEDVR